MIEGASPVTQALLGTLFTWAVTAAGSGLVFVFNSNQRKILDGSLGFAAGVMLAASYWSLLAPAIEMAAASGTYGTGGELAFIPASVGFILGAAFVYGSDALLKHLQLDNYNIVPVSNNYSGGAVSYKSVTTPTEDLPLVDGKPCHHSATLDSAVRRRTKDEKPDDLLQTDIGSKGDDLMVDDVHQNVNWKRILLLIVAITVHNIPGLAVGVAFGAIGKSPSATIENARNLAIGIGIQNFPEGLAVSMPLSGCGMSPWKSFWYGQLSGMVEPLAGVLGAAAVVVAEPMLPYALAFAAGAMIYVVINEVVPEANTSGNGLLATWTAIVGFIVMMSLDVGLG
ncbi:zinc transporter ZIP11-like isoform X2 [Corticium candelabrum]|uniref:zinc transporter ZIP11-like isoform X2 n=1 Tax=Corticium candelabrum TaxID=121492 RepID=UPI002E36F804|nr:zinc transporter ZIP11-like isoform X2 [Corticium candelabrum]